MEHNKEVYAVDGLPQDVDLHDAPLGALPKTKLQRIWPILTAGSGLFSDGYLNGVSEIAMCANQKTDRAQGNWQR